MDDMIQEAVFAGDDVRVTWRKRRPIPDAPRWFESVWQEYVRI